MSNFTCEYCGTDIIDSPYGYVTGCEHYPVMQTKRKLTKEEEYLLMAAGIATCNDVENSDET